MARDIRIIGEFGKCQDDGNKQVCKKMIYLIQIIDQVVWVPRRMSKGRKSFPGSLILPHIGMARGIGWTLRAAP